jgi:hypothetical protein
MVQIHLGPLTKFPGRQRFSCVVDKTLGLAGAGERQHVKALASQSRHNVTMDDEELKPYLDRLAEAGVALRTRDGAGAPWERAEDPDERDAAFRKIEDRGREVARRMLPCSFCGKSPKGWCVGQETSGSVRNVGTSAEPPSRRRVRTLSRASQSGGNHRPHPYQGEDKPAAAIREQDRASPPGARLDRRAMADHCEM